jgi:uncharacterized protein YtpQ (UPF0354 family)
MDEAMRRRLTVANLSPGELRTIYREALEGSGHEAKDSADDELVLQVKMRTGTMTVDLTRLYNEIIRGDATHRVQRFDDFLAATLEAMRNADSDTDRPTRDQLVPVVKGKHWLAGLPPNDLATAPFVGDLVVVYAFDQPHSFAFASVDELGMSLEDARSVALDNLRERIPHDLSTQGDGKSFMFTIGGNFEATLVLLPELWDQIGSQLPGDVVVCVLARDICLVTSTGTAGGVASLIEARNRILDGMPAQEVISPALLVRRGGAWGVFEAAA